MQARHTETGEIGICSKQRTLYDKETGHTLSDLVFLVAEGWHGQHTEI